MSERFYSAAPLVAGEFILTGGEAHHVATVRRFSPGDRITLFDGTGIECPAEVVDAGKKSVVLNILAVESVDRELPFPIVVASALPKGDRADFLIEKLTELGVARLVPLITSRSVVVPKESSVEKFERAVIEASKQCGRNRLMQIDPAQKWDAFLGRDDLPASRYVLHTARGSTDVRRSDEGVAVAIGPEGGFTPEEVERAVARGWRAASLGPRILRVETAAVAVAAVLAKSADQ